MFLNNYAKIQNAPHFISFSKIRENIPHLTTIHLATWLLPSNRAKVNRNIHRWLAGHYANRHANGPGLARSIFGSGPHTWKLNSLDDHQKKLIFLKQAFRVPSFNLCLLLLGSPFIWYPFCKTYAETDWSAISKVPPSWIFVITPSEFYQLIHIM